jgi:hypothetical protein
VSEPEPERSEDRVQAIRDMLEREARRAAESESADVSDDQDSARDVEVEDVSEVEDVEDDDSAADPVDPDVLAEEDALFGAAPVTSDAEDSVRSEASNSDEADAERHTGGTAAVNDLSADASIPRRSQTRENDPRTHPPSQTDNHPAECDGHAEASEERAETAPSRFIAKCRWCRTHFDAVEAVEAHADECRAEPVASCRYCREDISRQADPDEHLYGCEAFQTARERESRRARAGSMRNQDPDSGYFIDPAPHEFGAYVKYDTGLRSYFGFNSLQKEHDFEQYGRLKTSFVDSTGEEWAVEFGFKGSGIAPPEGEVAEELNWRLEEVREYTVYVYPPAYPSYEEAKEEGRQRVYYRISPRWPGIRTKEGLRPMSNPHKITGFDVEYDGSNIPFDEYPELLHGAVEALADRQGFRFKGRYAPIRPEDFAPGRIHTSSNIVDAELYVRVVKGKTGKIFAYDGVLHRIFQLLGNERRGYAKSVRDDTECEGYYHTATIDSMRAAEMLGGHRLAKEFKHYHMRNPDAVEGTPLENPKVGVSYQRSRSDEPVYWSDLRRLTRELDEALLNVLKWAGLPTRPDHQLYVADDHFKVTGSRRFRKLISNPLPHVVEQQDREWIAAMRNMNGTDTALVGELLTDGGHHTPAGLAEAIGVHIDTVYTSLKRLSGVVVHEYADVHLRSQYIAQQLLARIEGIKDSLAMDLEDSIDDLVRAETYADREDPWSRWLSLYGVEVEESDEGGRDRLSVGFEAATRQRARNILRSGGLAWAEATGRTLREFGYRFAASVPVRNGPTYAVENFAALFGTPG